jgi:hypothetical protein
VKSATDRTVLQRCGLRAHFAILLQKATINFLISLLLLGTEQFLPDRGLRNFLFRSFTKIVNIYIFLLKVKVKLTLEQAMKARRGREKRIALLFL